jgi:chemotaxis signal transduction protein
MSFSSTVDRRFILTKVDKVTLAFPANLVTETLLVERARVLTLPFYGAAIAGCFHAGGKVVPLVSPALFLGVQTNLMREVLTVVCLGEAAEHLAGVGILVERMIGSHVGFPSLQPQSTEAPMTNEIEQFDLALIGRDIFQPQRWRSSESSAY